jgi:capsular polysaccharide export protein
VESGNRIGAVDHKSILQYADGVATETDIENCIAAAEGLATMTSLAGFEALLRGKPVWTFGRPFFAGWGLTCDALDNPRRTRKLDLDQLVAGALILYPRYVHPASGIPCEVEDLVGYLESRRHMSPEQGGRRPRYWRAIWESFKPGARGRY